MCNIKKSFGGKENDKFKQLSEQQPELKKQYKQELNTEFWQEHKQEFNTEHKQEFN